MTTFLADQLLLAAGDGNPAGPEFGEASPVGLFLILLLLIGTILLVRSMNGHIKRLPESFDDPEQEPAQAPEKPEKSDKPEV